MKKHYSYEKDQAHKLYEVKKSNEIFRLNEIVRYLPNHIYWKDREGVYLGCNVEFSKLLGLSNPTEIIGKTDYDFLDEEEARKIYIQDMMVMESNQHVNVEEEGVDKNGQKALYLSTKRPLYDLDSNIIGVVGSSLDITERKKTEEALKKLTALTEETLYKKNEFINNMSHDMTTPLSGVLIMTEQLAKQEKNEFKKNCLVMVNNAMKDFMCYCSDVLSLAKEEKSPNKIVDEPFDIKDIINSVVNLQLPTATEKGLAINKNCDDKLPKILLGDRFRIKRILLDLMSNAVKFTNKGEINLTVDLEKPENEKREVLVKFTVKDTGVGISENEQKKIYERFVKFGDYVRQDTYTGQGLGLYNVKRLLDDLDGDVAVKSTKGIGSKFVFYLKLKVPLAGDNIETD